MFLPIEEFISSFFIVLLGAWKVREHRAAVRLVGLRYAKKGSTIIEVWEIISRLFAWLADELNVDFCCFQVFGG